MEKYTNTSVKTQTYTGKFEKNPAYKNINSSQFNKKLISKNNASHCLVS